MWRRCDGPLHVSGGFWLLLGWFLYANGWRLLLTVLAALMDMRDAGVLAEYTYTPTRDMSMGLFDLGAGVEYLVLHDSRARLVLDCLKRNGCHGTCRKAGTKRVFEF